MRVRKNKCCKKTCVKFGEKIDGQFGKKTSAKFGEK